MNSGKQFSERRCIKYYTDRLKNTFSLRIVSWHWPRLPAPFNPDYKVKYWLPLRVIVVHYTHSRNFHIHIHTGRFWINVHFFTLNFILKPIEILNATSKSSSNTGTQHFGQNTLWTNKICTFWIDFAFPFEVC